jgi:hypothetical protein
MLGYEKLHALSRSQGQTDLLLPRLQGICTIATQGQGFKIKR